MCTECTGKRSLLELKHGGVAAWECDVRGAESDTRQLSISAMAFLRNWNWKRSPFTLASSMGKPVAHCGWVLATVTKGPWSPSSCAVSGSSYSRRWNRCPRKGVLSGSCTVMNQEDQAVLADISSTPQTSVLLPSRIHCICSWLVVIR